MRLAMEKRGVRCVFSNEICPNKCKIYDQNFGKPSVTCADIRNIPSHKIPHADLATISFPCTDVSVIHQANRTLDGPKSSAVWYVLDLISKMGDSKPKFLLLENVVGLLTANSGRDILTLLDELEKIGYSYDITTLDAIHFVPQTRNRVFVFAIQTKLVHSATSCKEELHKRPLSIQRLWKQRPRPFLLSITQPRSEKKNIQDFIHDLPEHDELWFDDRKTQYWLQRLSGPVSQYNQRYYVGKRRHNAVHLKKESYCLLTSDRLVIFDLKDTPRIRYMTVDECLMLQGVSGFKFETVSTAVAIKFIGDAVCVPVVCYIMEAFARTMVGPLGVAGIFCCEK